MDLTVIPIYMLNNLKFITDVIERKKTQTNEEIFCKVLSDDIREFLERYNDKSK